MILQLKFGIIEIPFTSPYQFGNIGSNIVIEVVTNGIEIWIRYWGTTLELLNHLFISNNYAGIIVTSFIIERKPW